jgi:thiamine-phosphate pyrophosphorylase
MRPLSDCRLYTFIDTACLKGRDPAAVARQLCDGGSDLVQLRAKSCSPDEIRRIAESILPILDRSGVGLVINDHPDIARQVAAPWCHLGQEDFVQHSESLAPGAGLGYGLSTHSPAQAKHAMDSGASYLAVGPVYPTPTKPAAKPVTLDYVRWAALNVRIPWFAIGGINLQNLEEVLAAGARRVCAVSAILNAPDIAGACRDFKARLALTPLSSIGHLL